MLQSINPGVQITKYNFPRLLKEAWVNAMLSNNICAGFRNAGIYSLDPLRTIATYMHHGNNNITICKQIAVTSLLFTL